MFRTSDIVLIAVMVAAAAFTYKIKHEAENQPRAVRKIEARDRLEEDTIDAPQGRLEPADPAGAAAAAVGIYQAELQLQPFAAHQVAASTSSRRGRSKSWNSPDQRLGGMADSARRNRPRREDRAMIGLLAQSKRQVDRPAGSIVVDGARKSTGGTRQARACS